jgi:NAD(P)H-dependent FMN reductase
MSKILVIVGTVREGRVGRKIGDWYIKEAKKVAPEGMEFEIFDVAEHDVPLFSGLPPMMGKYSELQKNLAEKIGGADGYVFVTGEYDHSVPGSLKNFIDHLFAEWNHKAAAYVGYGSTGGVRAIEHLIQIMAELKVASVAHSFNNVHIHGITEALDDSGEPKADHMIGNVEGQLKELDWWVNALKTAREK